VDAASFGQSSLWDLNQIRTYKLERWWAIASGFDLICGRLRGLKPRTDAILVIGIEQIGSRAVIKIHV